MKKKAIRIELPLRREDIDRLRAGDEVLLSGVIYTARDQAHKRLAGALKAGKKIPVDLRGQVIYYTGPTPAPPGWPIGSCGPTTSSRMDPFTPFLLSRGLKGMIGKGERSAVVIGAIRKHRAVYFVALGGAGALAAARVESCRTAGFADLGTEAIHELRIRNFPLLVGVDAKGRDVYRREKKRTRKQLRKRAGPGKAG